MNYQHFLIRYIYFPCSCVYLACISVQFLNVAFDQITKSHISQKKWSLTFCIAGVISLIGWYSHSNNWLIRYCWRAQLYHMYTIDVYIIPLAHAHAARTCAILGQFVCSCQLRMSTTERQPMPRFIIKLIKIEVL